MKLIVCVVAIIAIFLAFVKPLAFSIRQGLDLQGGTHVVLEAEDTDIAKVNDDAMNRVVTIMEKRVNSLGLTEPIIQREGERRVIIELPGVKDPDAAIKTIGKTAMLEFKDEEGNTVLTGTDLKDAQAATNQQNGQNVVNLEFSDEGAQKFADLTTKNVGRTIAILLDGEVLTAPNVREPILGGRAEITGQKTLEEAQNLAVVLRSGALPVKVNIIETRTVGPTLGQDSKDKSVFAFAVGIGAVLIFMLLFYRLSGFIADVALMAYTVVLLALLYLLDATLTLPGVAGIILSIGMAVDANVLIFEHFKEEYQIQGKSLRLSMDAGFKRAFTTIFDSNITTIIAAGVLFFLGTGTIRGFAVTFMIGIISSFMTAVFLTRLMLDDYAKRPTAKPLAFTSNITKNWFQGTSFNFIGARKVTYIISGVLVVISIFGLEPHIFGHLNLGIDFSGGRNYVIRFAEPVQPEEIRTLLEDEFDGESVTVITIGNQNQVRVSTKYGIKSDDPNIDNDINARLYRGLNEKLGSEVSYEDFINGSAGNEDNVIGIMQSQKVGPSIADDIKVAAVWAILIALIVIALYILIRFRNISFSVGGIAALAHDSVIILGIYAIFWRIMPFSMEIDQSFIAAILTVIGYSINDTVVIFDRIREYNKLYAKRERMANINGAINATLSRTFSTSMSTFIVLFAIFLFGGSSIRGFVFALLLGVIIGTYSSIFVATPLAYDIQQAQDRRKARKLEQKK